MLQKYHKNPGVDRVTRFCYTRVIVQKTETVVGYRVLGRTEDIYQGYEPRQGLEGPYAFVGGRILYYDPRAGQYWDPKTDFYLEAEDMNYLNEELTRFLSR